MNRFRRFAAALLVGLSLAGSCQDHASLTVCESSDDAAHPSAQASEGSTSSVSGRRPSPTSHPGETSQGDGDEHRARFPQRRRPKRPKDSWIIFREPFEKDRDAFCTATWAGRNRFEVRTDNVRRLTADMTRLPKGAPTKGPWIIIIDGQGVELTGFRPKPGYTGLKRDLVRSKNGKWTVDRRKLYRPGE